MDHRSLVGLDCSKGKYKPWKLKPWKRSNALLQPFKGSGRIDILHPFKGSGRIDRRTEIQENALPIVAEFQ